MSGTARYRGLNVAVVVGGRSPEGDGSKLSGRTAREGLLDLGAEPVIVDLDAPGFLDRLHRADVAFVAGHGWYGEDGKLQGLLEMLEIPYTGPGVLSSAIAMHKPSFKRLLDANSLPTPRWLVLDRGMRHGRDLIEQRLAFPVFLKPSSGGYALGTDIARSPAEAESVMRSTPEFADQPYLAEEYIRGFSATVGVLEQDGARRTMPVMRRPQCKELPEDPTIYPELTRNECPARLGENLLKTMRDYALTVFELCECRGFARVDFMVDEWENLYILELNTIPGLSHHGNLAAMAEVEGTAYSELIAIMLDSAFDRPRYVP